MTKRMLTLVAFVLAFVAQAAAQRFVVAGSVNDSRTHEGIDFATVQLLRPDSTMATGTNSEGDGAFKLVVKEPGKYILKVSYVSYETQTRAINLTTENDSVNVGKIHLTSGDVKLATAVVSTTAAKVEQKEDTTVFNASAYRNPEGSTLESLVKQLPGVQVDDDGTITWNGKTVKEFLVNGKDFFKGDTKVAMKNLPVDLVSKLKAYDKKSDYAELTGIDDGEETTVLDISTKRALNESWIANIDLGYGNKDRYANRLFATRITDNSRITLFGSINNTNDMQFGGPRGFRGSNGLTATKSGGMDFYWGNGKQRREAGRFEVNGNARYSHRSTDAVTRTASETFLTSGSTSAFSNSSGRSVGSSTSAGGEFRLEWNPDSMTTLIFRPEFSYSKNKSTSNNLTGSFNSDPYAIDGVVSPLDSIFAANIMPSLEEIAINRNLRESLSDSWSGSMSASLMAIRRLNSKGRNISLRFSGSYGKGGNQNFSISDIHYFNRDNNNGDFLNQFSNAPTQNWKYSVGGGYTEPLGKNWYAEARYRYSYSYSDRDRSLYELDSIKGGTWNDPDNYPEIGTLPTKNEILQAVRDANNSQYATYKDYSHNINLGVRYNTKNIRFNAGVNFTPEDTKLAYERPGQNIDTIVTRHVFNVSPQLRFRYSFNKTSFLDIRYRGESSQPSMTDLLDVVDDSDPLNVSMGNPGLKPSWQNSLRAFLNNYNPERQQGIMGGFDFSQTKNSVSTLMVYDESTGSRYTRPQNINGNWNANLHFMFNTGLGKDKTYTITNFMRAGYENAVGYVARYNGGTATQQLFSTTQPLVDKYASIFDNAAASKNTTRTFNVRENLNLAYRASWFDVGVSGSINYQHSRSTLQSNANMDTYNFSYGVNGNVSLPWSMTLSTDVRMNSRRGYADRSMNTNELIWNAQVAQSFLKDKSLTLSVQFYDILHQQSTVSRVINAQMRSDSWNNSINQYFMVHLIYRLNIFGGKSKSGESNNRGRGGMPMRGIPMGPPPGGMR